MVRRAALQWGKGSLWNGPLFPRLPCYDWTYQSHLRWPEACTLPSSEGKELRRKSILGVSWRREGWGRDLGEYSAHRCPFPAQQMNESRNLPFHLPLSYPSPLQVEAEGSGGGGPGLREALERGYVARAHKRRVGKRRERNPFNSPSLGGCCCEPLNTLIRRVSYTWGLG